jgi:hypothetical protein
VVRYEEPTDNCVDRDGRPLSDAEDGSLVALKFSLTAGGVAVGME